MGRRRLDQVLAYAGTEGVLILAPGAGLSRKAPTSQHACERVPSKETYTKPSSPTGKGMGGANVRLSNPKRARGWGSPILLPLNLSRDGGGGVGGGLEGQAENTQLDW